MLILPIEKKLNWKRPPIALIIIVLINIIIFFTYQDLDSHRQENAVNFYHSNKLLKAELPAYQQYLAGKGEEKVDENTAYIEYIILSDYEFRQYLDNNSKSIISTSNYQRWHNSREQANQLWDKASYYAFGLKPSQVTPITLITHQFLHGGFWHLFGNLVFLLIFGFAVEAALGSIRFFSYYLISGVGAGLFFAFVENVINGAGYTPLVGASGAISGVTAMYLVLFRFQKIKFFYWILFFVGYFRAAALIILPIYILKEVYFHITDIGSNVAYTAHIGGFIAGAILVLLTQSLQKKSINNDYIEGKEEINEIDNYSIDLDKLYNQIGKCNFKQALDLFSKMKGKFGLNNELIVIEYNLIRALNHDKLPSFFLKYFGNTYKSPIIIQAQLGYWKSLSDQEQESIPFNKKHAFAIDLLLIDQVSTTEAIFEKLKIHDQTHRQEIAVLASNIARHYQGKNHQTKANDYQSHALTLMQNAS